MRMRSLTIAATAGMVLSLGALGTAGAATTHDHHGRGQHGHGFHVHGRQALGAKLAQLANGSSLPASFSCDKADKDLTRLAVATDVLNARIAKGTAAEAAATAAGDTARANAIAAKITKGTTIVGELASVTAKIETACPGSSASSNAQAIATKVEHRMHANRTVRQIATSGTLPASFSCDKAPKVEDRIAKAEQRLPKVIARLEARQAKASAAGHQRRAAVLAHEIKAATSVNADLAKVDTVIKNRCS